MFLYIAEFYFTLAPSYIHRLFLGKNSSSSLSVCRHPSSSILYLFFPQRHIFYVILSFNYIMHCTVLAIFSLSYFLYSTGLNVCSISYGLSRSWQSPFWKIKSFSLSWNSERYSHQAPTGVCPEIKGTFTFSFSPPGIERAHESGLLASLIGVEGGHAIGTSLGVLRMLYQLGARYLTLTHTCNTPWWVSSLRGITISLIHLDKSPYY
jgi:hypothetical protein